MYRYMPLFLLTACATAPIQLEQAKQAVDQRATYQHYNAWDKRILQTGDMGNCAAFSYSYQDEAMKRGIPTFVASCTLTNGQEHAFTMTYDRQWIMDVRHSTVIPFSQVGCQ